MESYFYIDIACRNSAHMHRPTAMRQPEKRTVREAEYCPTAAIGPSRSLQEGPIDRLMRLLAAVTAAAACARAACACAATTAAAGTALARLAGLGGLAETTFETGAELVQR